jgi:hypothetical protein
MDNYNLFSKIAPYSEGVNDARWHQAATLIRRLQLKIISHVSTISERLVVCYTEIMNICRFEEE